MSRREISTRTLLALSVVLIIVVAAVAAVLTSYRPQSTSTSGSSQAGTYVVTTNSSAYFPNGLSSHVVNFSKTHDGDSIVIGNVSFLYEVPSNLETRTMTRSTDGTTTTTVAVVTADYQCGTSLGQRRFFFAQFTDPGGSRTGTFTLDYCLVLNTAIAHGAYQGGVAHAWEYWQVSTGTSPPVAIHMVGSGEAVSLVELCVGK